MGYSVAICPMKWNLETSKSAGSFVHDSWQEKRADADNKNNCLTCHMK